MGPRLYSCIITGFQLLLLRVLHGQKPVAAVRGTASNLAHRSWLSLIRSLFAFDLFQSSFV